MKLYLNCDDNEVTFNKKNYLLRAAKRLGLDWVVDYNTSGVKDDVEYCLNIEPNHEVVRGSIWTGAWWIDCLLDNARLHNEWPHLDTMFLAITTNKIDQRDNHRFLPQAADLELHKPTKNEKFYDFCLAGTLGQGIYAERERCIQVLREHDFTYLSAGNGHKPSEYVKFLNQARVQFIRSMNVEGEGEIAQRFFECLAIGPVLTNYVPDLEETGLVEGTDYLSYKDDEEMLEKMELLIGDEGYRQHIAENGRKKSILYHSYENRLITIINTIKEFENK